MGRLPRISQTHNNASARSMVEVISRSQSSRPIAMEAASIAASLSGTTLE